MNAVNRELNQYRGCLIGGAVGDALGYPVEFLSLEGIYREWSNGITEFQLADGKARISDDTQMTLFTANGLLRGYTRFCMRGIMGSWESYVRLAYFDWLKTQVDEQIPDAKYRYSWLLDIPELYRRRAPGNTCLRALEAGGKGTIDNPINFSKGCGGIMRVAPVGLYLTKHSNTIEEIDMTAARCAAITHGHPLGYIPAAALGHIIAALITTDKTLKEIIIESVHITAKLFADQLQVDEFTEVMEKAIRLAQSEYNDIEAIRMLGQGWVAEETLAIACFCALRYEHDFEKAIVTAVNHDGDSDSTGAVTGNIVGTLLGYEGIPKKYLEHLELLDIIDEIATDLYNDCKMHEYSKEQNDMWTRKYVYYKGKETMNAKRFYEEFCKATNEDLRFEENKLYQGEPSLSENNAVIEFKENIQKRYILSDTQDDEKRLMHYYREEESNYTYIVNKIIIDEIIKKAGYQVQHEYFRIDSVGWISRYKEVKKEADTVGLSSHLWDLKIAVEHENSKSDWSDEVIKLIHIKCPLKVIIGYNYCDCRDEGKNSDMSKLNTISKWMNMVAAFESHDCEEYLIIIGNGETDDKKKENYTEFGYRGYVYTDDGFKQIDC